MLWGSINGYSMQEKVEINLEKDWCLTRHEWEALSDQERDEIVAGELRLEFGWGFKHE